MSEIERTSAGGNCEKFVEEKSVSENDENCETEDEDISENITVEISPKKKNEKIYFKRKTTKLLPGKLTVSLRNRKTNRQTKTKKLVRNAERKKVKKPPLKKISEKRVETPKLGKRCRLGGKAKVKFPAAQENQDKNDSDDDNDSTYFSRISIGHFQQLKDKSGASTSYQSEEERLFDGYLQPTKTGNETSEEEELKELQMWGRNVLDTYFCTLKNCGNYSKLLGHVNK